MPGPVADSATTAIVPSSPFPTTTTAEAARARGFRAVSKKTVCWPPVTETVPIPSASVSADEADSVAPPGSFWGVLGSSTAAKSRRSPGTGLIPPAVVRRNATAAVAPGLRDTLTWTGTRSKRWVGLSWGTRLSPHPTPHPTPMTTSPTMTRLSDPAAGTRGDVGLCVLLTADPAYQQADPSRWGRVGRSNRRRHTAATSVGNMRRGGPRRTPTMERYRGRV